MCLASLTAAVSAFKAGTGRHYFELTANDMAGSYVSFGLADAATNVEGCLHNSGWCVFGHPTNASQATYIKQQESVTLPCFRPGDRVGFLLNMDARTCEVFYNDKTKVIEVQALSARRF